LHVLLEFDRQCNVIATRRQVPQPICSAKTFPISRPSEENGAMTTTAPPLQAQLDEQRRLVDVDHFDITVRELIRMAVVDDEIRRAPVYQRKFRWDEDTESRLIESVLLGLPIPSFFMATNADGTWEVVDGLQRLSTLMHFTAEVANDWLEEIGKTKPLVLSGLEKLPDFNGLTYETLPTPIQLAFGKRGLRVTALSDKSNINARFEVFERLNTGGVALTPQEVRACIFQGSFVDYLRVLGEDPHFERLVKLQRLHQHDATREELVLKFFAYLNARSSFDGAVGAFLTTYMEGAVKSFDQPKNEHLFHKVVETLLEFTDDGPFLRSNYGTTPLVQLESAMVAAGEMIQNDETPKKPSAGWVDDAEWLKSSTKGTNTRSMLRDRIRRARELMS
jgi:hypothetical protein